jgi:hypothetical protein
LIRLTSLASLVALLVTVAAAKAFAADTQGVFDRYKTSLYQIQVLEVTSEAKASIGSGFEISADGLLATNYHVVSEVVTKPDEYRLIYKSVNGDTGALTVVDVDVVNDLALVKKEQPSAQHLAIAQSAPQKGEQIYSLGNPHDLGMIVVPGTYSGLADKSYYDRVHFTGSITPGMSGGPVLNENGEIVGVNVSTAGNQIGFLVPADKLQSLISHYQSSEEAIVLNDRIRQQLVDNQKNLIERLLNKEWPQVPLGQAKVIGEIEPFIHCWGDHKSPDDDRLYAETMNACRLGENIFLSSDVNTGPISYEFQWLASNSLNRFRFYELYKKQLAGGGPDNRVNKKNATNYSCHDDFVTMTDANNTVIKATFCARAYKEYSGLFDVFYIAGTVDQNQQALLAHFTLSGVEQATAEAFSRKFMESIEWMSL